MPPSPSTPERPDYDQALKRMFASAPQGFLDLIAPGLAWDRALSSELPAAARAADVVWKVKRADGRTGVLHVELQIKPSRDLGKRVAEYGLRIWLREDIPVRSIVVFLRRTKALPASPLVVNWMGEEERFRYTFDIVRLWELAPEQVLATDHFALWPLAALMAGATVDTMIETAERISSAPLPRSEQSEITGTLVLLAGVNLPFNAIIEAIRRRPMLDEIFEESSVAQWLIERGRKEGSEKGRRQMARDLARLALEGRFGTLHEDLLAALNAADETVLRDVVAHIGTDTLEQARARLGLG